MSFQKITVGAMPRYCEHPLMVQSIIHTALQPPVLQGPGLVWAKPSDTGAAEFFASGVQLFLEIPFY